MPAIYQCMMSLYRQGQPYFISFFKELSPGDARYGVRRVVMHGVLQAGEAHPGYRREVEVVVAPGFIFQGRILLHGFHALQDAPVEGLIIALVGYGAKAEYIRGFGQYCKRRVGQAVFYHLLSPDALPEGRDFVGRPGYAIDNGRGEPAGGGTQSGKQPADVHPGTDIEMGLAHFAEELEVLPAVLIGKLDYFHFREIFYEKNVMRMKRTSM